MTDTLTPKQSVSPEIYIGLHDSTKADIHLARFNWINIIVCDYFKISPHKVKETSRKREVVKVRQIAMYLMAKHSKITLKNIGEHFGGKNHSTVIYAKQTVEDLMDSDKKYKADVLAIEQLLKLN